MPMTPEEEFEALLDSLPSPEHTPRNPDVVPYLGKKPIKAGAKRAKPKDFTPLVRKFWEERGYQCDRVDGWISVGGMFRKKDFQGCWDVLCTKPNQTPTLIQICARDGLAAHKRKLRSEEPAVDNSRPRIHNVRHMLACGFRLLLHVVDQPGGRGTAYNHDLVEVDEELLSTPTRGKAVK